jgi:hypothetical protein
MDFHSLMTQGRSRHAELIAEAEREALFAKIGDKSPSLITRIANLFATRKTAQPVQSITPRTAPAK